MPAKTGTRCFWALLFALLSAGSAAAEDLNWAQKMFDKQTIDFGVVARGADVMYPLKVKNIYQQTVHITTVGTSCGCSATREPEKTTLNPGEETVIEVTMDTQRFMRRKDSNVIVTFDLPLAAEVRIPLTVYIRSDVVLTPGAVNFGAVARGTGSERTVEIAYAGRNDWHIREVKTPGDYLVAQLVETGRSDGRVGYKLHVKLDPAAPVGLLRDQITLVTDDANSPHVPVMVEGKIEADITVTPEVVSLGMLTPGQNKTVNVVLRGRTPFAIEEIICEHDNGMFRVRLPKEARSVHVLPMTITPPNELGALNEEFTVKIAGRAEPIVFKAYGKVIAGEIR